MPKLQPQRFFVDVSNWQLNAPSADVDGEFFFLPLFFPSDGCFGISRRSSTNQFSWSGVVLTDGFCWWWWVGGVSFTTERPNLINLSMRIRQVIDKAILSI
jgi:hypothetical protein